MMLSHTFTILFMLLVMGSGFTISSCTPKVEPKTTYEALSWETESKPERKEWSTALFGIVDKNFEKLDQAKDIVNFCPKYALLSHPQQANVFAEIISSTAYYESSWNPASASVDVGSAGDKDTWSVGLMQMSVVDQESYGFDMGYNYADLLKPIPNLELATAIMGRQVKKYGKIMIPTGESGLYWAVLHPGGKYDHSKDIIARVQKQLSFCK